MRLELTASQRQACEPIFKYAEERLANLRIENDQQSLDAAQTAHKRGQIQAFKELLLLAKPPRTEGLPPGQ